jgi:hypothetical protein
MNRRIERRRELRQGDRAALAGDLPRSRGAKGRRKADGIAADRAESAAAAGAALPRSD